MRFYCSPDAGTFLEATILDVWLQCMDRLNELLGDRLKVMGLVLRLVVTSILVALSVLPEVNQLIEEPSLMESNASSGHATGG